MGRLIYSMFTSLDGYVEDEDGGFDWAAPIVSPVVVGGGKRFLPEGVRLGLELVEERAFAGGTVALRYAVRR